VVGSAGVQEEAASPTRPDARWICEDALCWRQPHRLTTHDHRLQQNRSQQIN